jgi:hypothetical protein
LLALLTYALPKSPSWLVVEFYAGNDVPEAIRDDVCQRGGDFRCRYNDPEVQRRLAHHPIYPTIFNVRTDVWARLADYSLENLTLATTRYLTDAMKGAIKQRLAVLFHAAPSHDAAHKFSHTKLSMGGPPVPVREGQWLAYVQAGIAATQQQYERLGAALEGREYKPTVILLYNPAPYEVYRGMGMEQNPRAEQMYPFQREALCAFAHTHGWHFLDLTEPLRGAVRGGEVWLYGYYDQSHWSPQGTAIVADVFAAELLKIVSVNQEGQKTHDTGGEFKNE